MDRLSTTPRDAGRGYGPAGFRQIIWRALPNLDAHLQTSGQKTTGVARAPSRPAPGSPDIRQRCIRPLRWHGRRLRGGTGHTPACRAGASECMRGLVAGEVQIRGEVDVASWSAAGSGAPGPRNQASSDAVRSSEACSRLWHRSKADRSERICGIWWKLWCGGGELVAHSRLLPSQGWSRRACRTAATTARSMFQRV
jgi:hypothetical protein